jgi:Tfp pilus assembly protein PilF
MKNEPMTSIRIALSALVGLGLAACATVPAPQAPAPQAPPPAAPVAPSHAESSWPQEKHADALFADAVQAFDAQKYDEAEELFEEVLDEAPNNVSAAYNLGVVSERKGDFRKAQQRYEAAHKLDPNHTPTLLNLGKVYRLQAKFEQAIALYEAALKAPGREFDSQLLNNLAVSYRLAKRYDKAEETLRKVLSRTIDNPEAYKNLALVYYDQGNYRLAEFVSATARKLDEKDPGVYNNLGMIYLKQDEKARALAQCQKAVQLDPNFAPGHLNIGAMALSYRDYENAEQSLRKALELDAASPEGRYYLAWALEGQRGRNPKKGLEAGAEFEQYLKWRPDDASAVCGAGWAYSADPSTFEKAIGFFEKCKAGSRTLSQADVDLIDAKVKGLQQLLKSPPQQAASQEGKREAPKTTEAGRTLVDKVSAEEAAQEAAQPASSGDTPSGNGQAPGAGASSSGGTPQSQ